VPTAQARAQLSDRIDEFRDASTRENVTWLSGFLSGQPHNRGMVRGHPDAQNNETRPQGSSNRVRLLPITSAIVFCN